MMTPDGNDRTGKACMVWGGLNKKVAGYKPGQKLVALSYLWCSLKKRGRLAYI
jgi:hypothetical protein